jgi:exodeoxyribonuclease VII large subunit
MRSMDGTEHIYSASELLREARLHIEMGFPRVLVEAEISNLSRPASGHLYFSLKDDKAQVRCALFRSAANRLRIHPENGMKVIARGRLSLYEARGDFQMIVDGLRDAGEGELQRQFEALKKKLQAEGLFDEARKQALPPNPGRIALVTSPGGAAVRDILQVLKRRWPLAKVRLYPVTVQGDTAANEMIAALKAADRHDWAELLIIGRGGGSLEDLAAFNDESLARQLAKSRLPVVSAVGHETDFSICDFVADLRAPTPSAAAELVSPDISQLAQQFRQVERRLGSRMMQQAQRKAQQLDYLVHRLNQQHPGKGIQRTMDRLAQLDVRLGRAMRLGLGQEYRRLESWRHRLEARHPGRQLAEFRARLNSASLRWPALGRQVTQSRQERLRDLVRTLNAVSPLHVLARGYAALSDSQTGAVISGVGGVSPGDSIQARLADGRLDCTVDRILPADQPTDD